MSGEWKLNVGNLDVMFLSTKKGSLGIKFNDGKDRGHTEIYAPAYTDKKIPPYDPKNPKDMFYATRYVDEKNTKYLKSDEVVKKWYDKEKPEVLIPEDKIKQMYPLTKEAKVLAKQSMDKLNLKNVSAHDGYYLIPKRDYENIQKYKKMIEYLGDEFIITSPMRLRVGSVTDHNYAIFVDKSKNSLVALEVLVKSGMKPEPTF